MIETRVKGDKLGLISLLLGLEQYRKSSSMVWVERKKPK